MAILLSVIGLIEADPNLFENMYVPEYVDADPFFHELIYEIGELEVIYPDPGFMKEAIGAWSYTMAPKWERIAAVMSAEYNPLWNKDGTFYEKEKLNNTAGTKVSAFNSSTFVDSGQVNNNGTVERWRTEQGNIGVTTSQEMVKEEVDVANINLYRIIIDDFKQRFCLMVY